MAGLGRKDFAAGDVLSAADVDGYLMDQAVMKFASDAARSAAIGTAVSAGMVSYRTDGTALELYNGSAWVSPPLLNSVFTGAPLENAYLVGTGFAGYTFNATTNGAVHYITANSTGTGTLNIRSSSTVSLNTLMAVGQSMTIALALTQTTTGYLPNAYQIDGSGVTVKWANGSSPSASASAIDVIQLTIIKTASATYTVLGSVTKFA